MNKLYLTLKESWKEGKKVQATGWCFPVYGT